MKKATFILISAVLLLMPSSVFATGQDEQSSSDKPVELIWYIPGGSGFPYAAADEQEVYSAINEMLKRDLGITVDVRATGGFGEYKETMPLAMAAGEKFDVVWTAHWCNNFMDAASDGYYAGLDELLPEYAPTIWKDTKDALESTRVNGEIRGVWSQQIAAKTSNFFLLEGMIDKYGWDVDSIKELKDLEPILAQVKAEEPDMIPLSMRKPIPMWMTQDLGYGEVGILSELLAIRMDDKSCKVFNLIEDPGYVQYIDIARDWYAKGFIPTDGLTYNNDQWQQMVNSGKVAVKLHNFQGKLRLNFTTPGFRARIKWLLLLAMSGIRYHLTVRVSCRAVTLQLPSMLSVPVLKIRLRLSKCWNTSGQILKLTICSPGGLKESITQKTVMDLLLPSRMAVISQTSHGYSGTLSFPI